MLNPAIESGDLAVSLAAKTNQTIRALGANLVN
jgi:hypothetical protein